MFTLDYAKYLIRGNYILASSKVVDIYAKIPVDGSLLMADGKNAQANEELTCIPLHFVNTKESHEVFTSDLKSFFDFGKKCLADGFVTRGQGEISLLPFKNCAFPMDISAEQKCLNVGGGCKVAERFCTKCSCRSSQLSYC